MHMNRLRKAYPVRSAALAALALFWACKPPASSSVVYDETGGAAADMTLRSSLASAGELRLERSGGAVANDNYSIGSVQFQVSTSPDGQIYSSVLKANTWLAMRSGDGNLKFNILMTTKGAGLCYVNGATLSGNSDPVSCKGATAADPAVVAANQRACSEAQSSSPSGTVLVNSDICICGVKGLRYDDPAYANQPDKFRVDCANAAAGTATATGTDPGIGTE